MRTVLIAEDGPVVRELLRTALTIAGYEVLAVADGNEAWGVLQARSLAALVTDLHLPGRDGLDLTRSIRADDRLGALPVVMVTGASAAEASALMAGADRVVMKPFTLGAVGSAVAEAIAARRPMEMPA